MAAGAHTEQTSCASCTFFDDAQAKSEGVCRHNPPSGGNGHTAWPTVSARDWCGQFVFDGHGSAGARQSYASA